MRTDRLVAEPWYLDEIESAGGIVSLRGWAFQVPGIPVEQQGARCTVNGVAPLTLSYPTPRPDVQEVFWRRRDSTMCGFQLTAVADFPNGVMEVRFEDPTNSATARGRESWFLPDPNLHSNLPDAERRFRVIGNRDAAGFLSLGCTDAQRIILAYESVTGRKWHDATAVLDWGVGCGRVARHLAPSLGDRFFGCDIDADNISWCAKNLPGGYKASRLDPPLPYGDSTFDVIYGISVFTHLRESWEMRWLGELHRVLRPGGVILMTVHGQTAIDFAGLAPAAFQVLVDRVNTEGLVVTGQNNQLDGFVENPDEYVNVYHSRQHINHIWGKYFAKVDLLPGFIFTHDLVVAQK